MVSAVFTVAVPFRARSICHASAPAIFSRMRLTRSAGIMAPASPGPYCLLMWGKIHPRKGSCSPLFLFQVLNVSMLAHGALTPPRKILYSERPHGVGDGYFLLLLFRCRLVPADSPRVEKHPGRKSKWPP